jgi:hypothetical protein
MASLTRAHGNSKMMYAGKEVALTKLAKSNITQAELDGCIAFIGLTATVVGIGDDTDDGQFNAGASDEVHVLSEGAAPAAGSNFGGQTGVTSSVVAYFN